MLTAVIVIRITFLYKHGVNKMPFKDFVLRNTGVYSAFAHHYESRGNSLYAQGKYSEAKDAYINAVSYGAGGGCQCRLASCYQKLDEILSARIWFSSVSGSNYNVEAAAGLANCNTILTNRASAYIKQAEELCASDPSTALAKLSEADKLLSNIEAARALQQD